MSTNLLTIETSLVDPDKYGLVLESLMDALAAAAKEISDEGVAVRIVLSDTSSVDAEILNLDYLEPTALVSA